MAFAYALSALQRPPPSAVSALQRYGMLPSSAERVSPVFRRPASSRDDALGASERAVVQSSSARARLASSLADALQCAERDQALLLSAAQADAADAAQRHAYALRVAEERAEELQGVLAAAQAEMVDARDEAAAANADAASARQALARAAARLGDATAELSQARGLALAVASESEALEEDCAALRADRQRLHAQLGAARAASEAAQAELSSALRLARNAAQVAREREAAALALCAALLLLIPPQTDEADRRVRDAAARALHADARPTQTSPLAQLSAAELRAVLRKMHLDSRGARADLAARLAGALGQ